MTDKPPKLTIAPEIHIGSQVKTVGLPRCYTVIAGPNRRDQFQVALGQLTLWIDRSKLELATEDKKRATKIRKRPAAASATTKQRTLDLHGIRVKEALETLEQTIDRALVEGTTQLEIVHGLGTGKLKVAIHHYLKSCRSISAFKLDDLNPGTTWIYL